MKLNNGCPLYRYEIARILNMGVKKLYRFLKANNIKIQGGLVMPCDLDKIDAVIFGEKEAKNDPNQGLYG